MIPRKGVSVLVVVISTAWILGSVVDADSYSQPPPSRRVHSRREFLHPPRNEFSRSPLPHQESHPETEEAMGGFMRGPATSRFQEQSPYSRVQELLSRARRSADRTPYIHFDTYKSGRSAERLYAGGNETGHGHGLVSDSHSEEQRFFPSFPPYFPSFGENALRAAAPLFPAPHRSPSASRYLSSGGGGGAFKFRGSPSTSASDRYVESNLLGSGNFEVVRGGTYYGDEDYNDYHDPYSNSHSPQGYRGGGGGGGDFFANFRDFADINPNRAYSERSEVAVAGSHPKPKFSMEYVDPMEAND